MNESEKNIILDFSTSIISMDDFYKKMPQYKNEDFIIKRYNEVISTRDREALCCLRLVPVNNIKHFESIYKKLLLEDWHIEHEDLIGFFQWDFNNNAENIPLLLLALVKRPKYLNGDEATKYSYIKKIIYAVGAQPQPESLSALEKLASRTRDEKIKELALHQLEKRKKLGRWEYERNKQIEK